MERDAGRILDPAIFTVFRELLERSGAAVAA
jgi:hypothetical protein